MDPNQLMEEKRQKYIRDLDALTLLLQTKLDINIQMCSELATAYGITQLPLEAWADEKVPWLGLRFTDRTMSKLQEFQSKFARDITTIHGVDVCGSTPGRSKRASQCKEQFKNAVDMSIIRKELDAQIDIPSVDVDGTDHASRNIEDGNSKPDDNEELINNEEIPPDPAQPSSCPPISMELGNDAASSHNVIDSTKRAEIEDNDDSGPSVESTDVEMTVVSDDGTLSSKQSDGSKNSPDIAEENDCQLSGTQTDVEMTDVSNERTQLNPSNVYADKKSPDNADNHELRLFFASSEALKKSGERTCSNSSANDIDKEKFGNNDRQNYEKEVFYRGPKRKMRIVSFERPSVTEIDWLTILEDSEQAEQKEIRTPAKVTVPLKNLHKDINLKVYSSIDIETFDDPFRIHTGASSSISKQDFLLVPISIVCPMRQDPIVVGDNTILQSSQEHAEPSACVTRTSHSTVESEQLSVHLHSILERILKAKQQGLNIVLVEENDLSEPAKPQLPSSVQPGHVPEENAEALPSNQSVNSENKSEEEEDVEINEANLEEIESINSSEDSSDGLMLGALDFNNYLAHLYDELLKDELMISPEFVEKSFHLCMVYCECISFLADTPFIRKTFTTVHDFHDAISNQITESPQLCYQHAVTKFVEMVINYMAIAVDNFHFEKWKTFIVQCISCFSEPDVRSEHGVRSVKEIIKYLNRFIHKDADCFGISNLLRLTFCIYDEILSDTIPYDIQVRRIRTFLTKVIFPLYRMKESYVTPITRGFSLRTLYECLEFKDDFNEFRAILLRKTLHHSLAFIIIKYPVHIPFIMSNLHHLWENFVHLKCRPLKFEIRDIIGEMDDCTFLSDAKIGFSDAMMKMRSIYENLEATTLSLKDTTRSRLERLKSFLK